jgi:hypothetical protein
LRTVRYLYGLNSVYTLVDNEEGHSKTMEVTEQDRTKENERVGVWEEWAKQQHEVRDSSGNRENVKWHILWK